MGLVGTRVGDRGRIPPPHIECAIIKGDPDGGIHKLDLVSHDIFLSATTFDPKMVLIRYFFIISINIVTDPRADPLMSDFVTLPVPIQLIIAILWYAQGIVCSTVKLVPHS